MKVLSFIQTYWTQIIFLCGVFIAIVKYIKITNDGVKCSLRNDILEIWDKCKDTKKITLYQLQAMEMTYEHYKKLKGNSFVCEIMEKVKNFEIVD